MPKRSQKTLEREGKEDLSTVEKERDGEGEVAKYKDYSKVFTPSKIASQMVELLEVEEHHAVLEPSAGLGALIRAMHRKHPTVWTDYFELNESHATQIFLSQPNAIFRGHDFMTAAVPSYDRIIANPPFDEDKWLAHTAKMFKCLREGGIMVCIVPRESVVGADISKFKQRMKELRAESIPLENWHQNRDGTKTDIHIIKVRKHG